VDSLRAADCDVEAIFANRVDPELVHRISGRLAGREPPLFVLP
jgi:hypothetical protein